MYPALPPRPTSGKATASMWLGILGFIFGVCTFGVLSVLAVVFGHLALSEIKKTGLEGHGRAITGLVFGYFMVIGIPISIAVMLSTS